ncbi:MAG: DNA translocase FtsK [Helicobacter sp.]|nr:DNA translocase FtsK [Helicobacter sp.]
MEKLKKIEKTLYREPQTQDNTLKLIPKSEIQSPQTLEQSPETIQETPKEPKKIKPIKTYPKDLYAPKPFSAYLENDNTPTKEMIPSINKESTLPNTIFYYSKKDNQTPKEIPQEEKHQETIENLQITTLNTSTTQTIKETSRNYTKPPSSATTPIQEETKILQSMPENQTYESPKNYSTNFFSNNEIPLYGFTNVTPHHQIPTPQNSPSYPINTQLQPNIQQNKIQFPTTSLETQETQNTPQESPSKETLLDETPQIPQVKTLEENEALLHQMDYNTTEKPKEQEFILPKLEFLQLPQEERIEIDESEIDRKINDLLSKLRMFKIEGDIVRTYSGPIVTTFEFRPSPNVKVSRILTLQDDLAMALRAKTIRIQAPVPGKDVVGIEIPNNQIQTIYLRKILENDLFQSSASPLTLALGKDIVGNPFITDLKKLPHLLIAGTTGSGKSVGINAMILSLLYKNTPDELKLIMIDPKMLEFSIYNDIPHLLTPVITQPKKAIIALDNTVKEMERRYALMSEIRTKNIEGYNQKAQIEGFEPFPYIVVIIDELADLMMSGGKEAEISISRLAQMARASGIHLIVATQRPSVDVVTGIIKANLPSRISYKVGQKIDSKVILDTFGAESLLGRGDMLFTPPSGGIVRLHAPWSTEHEIEEIVNFIKSQRAANYDENFMPSEDESLGLRYEGETDELYEEAKRIILNDGKTSISYIQRRLGIGYNKAANIIEQMQTRGFLSEPNSKGVREILGE